MADSTSARSAFWLTEKLGRTSHPIRSFLRGEKETGKQPSPSTYPDMYEEMSTQSCRRVGCIDTLMSYITVFSIATLGIKASVDTGSISQRETTSLGTTLAQPHAAVRAPPI